MCYVFLNQVSVSPTKIQTKLRISNFMTANPFEEKELRDLIEN